MWNFKGLFWNSTKNLIHTISYNVEILRVRRFKISYAFSKRPWEPMLIRPASRGDISTLQIPLLFMSDMCNHIGCLWVSYSTYERFNPHKTDYVFMSRDNPVAMHINVLQSHIFNILRPEQVGRHFTHDSCIFLFALVLSFDKISLTFFSLKV